MELFVTADDRTGALETAAALADAGAGSVDAVVWPSVPSQRPGVVVVDLGTRHLSADEARQRMVSITSRSRRGHKIDSTLRGNWPDELAVMAADRPVLLIPALPELGRTCVDGIVREHGRPVHEGGAGTDVRRPVTSARPDELLREVGVPAVTSLTDVEATHRWLDRPHGLAVADAAHSATIDRLVAAWSDGRSDVVLAGTAAVLGAAARMSDGRALPVPFRTVEPPVLVVCGSAHRAARAQIDCVDRSAVPVMTASDEVSVHHLAHGSALVLATEHQVGDVDVRHAEAAASALARAVDRLQEGVAVGALVLIGGDTSAAVLGAASVTVHGSIAAGTAWAEADGFEMPVITRAGGFGDDDALLELIRATLRS